MANSHVIESNRFDWRVHRDVMTDAYRDCSRPRLCLNLKHGSFSEEKRKGKC